MRTIQLTRPLRALLAALALALLAAGPGRAAEPAIVILSPQPEETIHDNSGRVAVSVGLADEAALSEGRRIRLLLDGAPVGPDQAGPAAELHGVVRGEHSLQAVLVDAAGNPLTSSAPVRFYMWQASRLFPSRRQ